MTMTLNPEIYHASLSTDQRRAQVVYLHEVLDYGYKAIAAVTDYAVSTVRAYCKKFIGLLDKAKEWFSERKKSSSTVLAVW